MSIRLLDYWECCATRRRVANYRDPLRSNKRAPGAASSDVARAQGSRCPGARPHPRRRSQQPGKATAHGHHTLRYLRLTRLRAQAWFTRTEGVKTFTAGHLADDEGIAVEAEGVFGQPRWARDLPKPVRRVHFSSSSGVRVIGDQQMLSSRA